MNKRAKWITVDGLDGAGKGTVIDLFKSSLESTGKEVKVFKVIGTGIAGEGLRAAIMTSKLSRATAAMSLATCFTDTYHNVMQSINDYDLIIVDRYIASFFAYDCVAAKDKDDSSISDLGNVLLDSVLLNKRIMPESPDYEIFVNCDPAMCKERIDKRDEEKKYLDHKPIEHFITSSEAYLKYYTTRVPGFINIENKGSLEDLENNVLNTILLLGL